MSLRGQGHAPLAERLLRQADRSGGPDACWPWLSALDEDGYGRIREAGKGSAMLGAHRASYQLFVGPIPDGLVLRHRCGNASCVNYRHLVPGTQAENIADREAMGNTARGERGSKARLTSDQVAEMKRLFADGATVSQLARRYGVNTGSAWCIVHGRNWKHVPASPPLVHSEPSPEARS